MNPMQSYEDDSDADDQRMADRLGRLTPIARERTMIHESNPSNLHPSVRQSFLSGPKPTLRELLVSLDKSRQDPVIWAFITQLDQGFHDESDIVRSLIQTLIEQRNAYRTAYEAALRTSPVAFTLPPRGDDV